MTNQKKGAQIGVFHILKSIVDTKVPGLHDTVSAGKRAQVEYPVLVDNIKAQRQYIRNCRIFDPSEYREATADLDDKEMQLDGIQKRIDNGRAAERELSAAQSFNTTYNTILKKHHNNTRIRGLNALKYSLYDQLYQLDDKIWGCQINMDLSCRSHDLVTQAQSDMDIYMKEYSELEERIKKINQKIEQLQK